MISFVRNPINKYCVVIHNSQSGFKKVLDPNFKQTDEKNQNKTFKDRLRLFRTGDKPVSTPETRKQPKINPTIQRGGVCCREQQGQTNKTRRRAHPKECATGCYKYAAKNQTKTKSEIKHEKQFTQSLRRSSLWKPSAKY